MVRVLHLVAREAVSSVERDRMTKGREGTVERTTGDEAKCCPDVPKLLWRVGWGLRRQKRLWERVSPAESVDRER